MWTATGSLSTARLRAHGDAAAVRQGAGRGGIKWCCLDSAELYDSATGLWTATGTLGAARYAHTATLLPSGKVLVAGGANRGILSSAELYDPATGLWTMTGSLGTARPSHGDAAALGQGAGGRRMEWRECLFEQRGILRSGEGVDGDRQSGRIRTLYTATLLPNGKVLVAGGTDNVVPWSTAELYDQGLGYQPAWQPLLTTVSPSILPSGSALTASGSRFKGISEASGGTARRTLRPITRSSNC